MKAMIFAAGLGTRLLPLTENLPKALVPVNSKPLLEHVIVKLRAAGFNKIIINIHHLADQIKTYLKKNNYFGLDITLSKEEQLLDTGGGLKKAAWFFEDDEPFLVHNVDILSDINLSSLYKAHLEQKVLATLAVKHRKTKRYLLFDQNGFLIGREIDKKIIPARPGEKLINYQRLSFLGIHVISPQLFRFFPDQDIFSILDVYLNGSNAGRKINFTIPEHTYWFDLGRSENLREAEKII
jgi:NDP-sugar pyrophosphorylase family protein